MIRTIQSLSLFTVFLTFVVTVESIAQMPKATVNVNIEKLTQQETKDKLINFKNDLEEYINNHDWTDNTHRYDIPVQVDIMIERAKPTSFEDRWDALFVISNGSDFQESDKRWTFAYRQGDVFNHGGDFHSLTSMLDFYIYIMLGQEIDKKTKTGGTSFYEKANEIVQLSKFSEFFQTGWKERSNRIAKILSEDNIKLRELEYFFVQATQWMRLDNRKTTSQYLRVILIRLKEIDPEKEGLNRFYQLHHLELARLFSVNGLNDELTELSTLDPSNIETYRQFLTKGQ